MDSCVVRQAFPHRFSSGKEIPYDAHDSGAPGVNLQSAPPLADSAATSARRWWVLMLAALAVSSSYYESDAIGPIADLLHRQLGFTQSQLGTLNGIINVPSVVLGDSSSARAKAPSSSPSSPFSPAGFRRAASRWDGARTVDLCIQPVRRIHQ
jgi:hypothetical protein